MNLLGRFVSALNGRNFWLRLDKTYSINKDGLHVILMPENDRELNEQALRHIDDMVKYRRANGVIILTNQQWILDSAQSVSDSIKTVHMISDKKIDALLSFYELYEFTERLATISLTRPFNRQVHRALGVHGITKEDLVCICIYQIRDWTALEG